MGKLVEEAKKVEKAREAKANAEEVVNQEADDTAKAVKIATKSQNDTENQIVKLKKSLKACQEVECMMTVLRQIKTAEKSLQDNKDLVKSTIEKAADKAKASDSQ